MQLKEVLLKAYMYAMCGFYVAFARGLLAYRM